MPPGEYFLEVRFEDTPVRVVGKWVSVVSLLLVMGAVIGLRIVRRADRR